MEFLYSQQITAVVAGVVCSEPSAVSYTTRDVIFMELNVLFRGRDTQKHSHAVPGSVGFVQLSHRKCGMDSKFHFISFTDGWLVNSC